MGMGMHSGHPAANGLRGPVHETYTLHMHMRMEDDEASTESMRSKGIAESGAVKIVAEELKPVAMAAGVSRPAAFSTGRPG